MGPIERLLGLTDPDSHTDTSIDLLTGPRLMTFPYNEVWVIDSGNITGIFMQFTLDHNFIKTL